MTAPCTKQKGGHRTMARWGKWRPIEEIIDDPSLQDKRGVYQVRMVDERNRPLSIHRIAETDPNGIIYIGQSVGLRRRLLDFYRGNHSGGGMYWLVFRRLNKVIPHRLQVRVMASADDNTETNLIRGYFREFCELPPFNSTVRGGK